MKKIMSLIFWATLPDIPSYVHHFSQITEDDPENENDWKDFKTLTSTLSADYYIYISFKRSHFNTPHLNLIFICR